MDRREFLATTGTGLISTTAGCSDIIKLIPSIGEPSIPPFVGGWAEVRTNGTTEFVLRFDGDIEQEINRYDVSGDDFLDDENTNINIRIQATPVNIPDDVPSEETVEGTLENFVIRNDSWPFAPWYITGRVWLKDDIETKPRPSITITFPSGYVHQLPARRVLDDLDYRGHEGIHDYNGHKRSRTIPAITHYDHEALANLSAAAQYRVQLTADLAPMYSLETYKDDNMEDVIDAIQPIVVKLAEEGLEGIITSPLGVASSGVVDLKSLHGTLDEDFEELRNALDSFNDISSALINESWMNRVRRTLTDLHSNSRQAYHRNIALVTAFNEEGFPYHLKMKKETLQQGLQRLQTGQDGLRNGPGPSGGDYWRNLHQIAKAVYREFAESYRKEIQALDIIRSGFANDE